MGTLIYETPGFKRELVYDDNILVRTLYEEREGIQNGMVFLGRVEAYHHNIKGFFIDLGDYKGIYQGKENLHIGKHYLFEVRKSQRGKHAVLSRRVSLIGKYLVYRPTDKTECSKNISKSECEYLLSLGLENVYIKRNATDVSTYKLKDEAKHLKEQYDSFLNIEKFQRRARCLYAPSKKSSLVDQSQILTFEEELFRLRQMVVFHEELQFFIEVTKIGLVIDVNSAKFKGEPSEMNDVAMEFISDLLIRMNVGGLILVDLIGKGTQRHFHDLMKKDPRITGVNISKYGILEIIRKREGVNLYDVPILEMLADLIKLKISYRDQEIQTIDVNEQFKGLEEYLPHYSINYRKMFGWFKLR